MRQWAADGELSLVERVGNRVDQIPGDDAPEPLAEAVEERLAGIVSRARTGAS